MLDVRNRTIHFANINSIHQFLVPPWRHVEPAFLTTRIYMRRSRSVVMFSTYAVFFSKSCACTFQMDYGVTCWSTHVIQFAGLRWWP